MAVIMAANSNGSVVNRLSSNNWRTSLVPAPAVIPAPIAYVNVVAVKTLVVAVGPTESSRKPCRVHVPFSRKGGGAPVDEQGFDVGTDQSAPRRTVRRLQGSRALLPSNRPRPG